MFEWMCVYALDAKYASACTGERAAGHVLPCVGECHDLHVTYTYKLCPYICMVYCLDPQTLPPPQINFKAGPPQGFVLFTTYSAAAAAVSVLQQLEYDQEVCVCVRGGGRGQEVTPPMCICTDVI